METTEKKRKFESDEKLISNTGNSGNSEFSNSGTNNMVINSNRQVDNNNNSGNNNSIKSLTPKIPKSIFSKHVQSDISLQVHEFIQKSLNICYQEMESIKRKEFVLDVDIEIEAKLGIIIDKQTNKRVSFPICSETIVNNDFNEFGFESNMTMDQHAKFNRFLNSNVTKESNVKYLHLRELDKFYNVRGIGKVRRTVSESSNMIKSCITKKRVNDLLVFCPADPLDFRISVNLEVSVLPSEQEMDLEAPEMVRKKDRLSYTLFPCQVDLTQVITNENRDREPSKKHELEVELTVTKDMISSFRNGGTRGMEYTDSFLNNIRVLVRHKAKENKPF